MKLLDVLFKSKEVVVDINVYNHREARIKVLDLIRDTNRGYKNGIFRVVYYSDVITVNSFDKTVTSRSLCMVQLVNTMLIGMRSDYKVSLTK